MGPFLFIFLCFLLLLVLFAAVGIGIGFLFHWLIPAIGVDIGILIGVVTLGWMIHLFAQLTKAVLAYGASDMEEDDSEDETIILRPVRPRRRTKRKK